MTGRRNWIALIGQYLAGQGLINLLNILTGLFLLRVLPVEEFALFTIAIILQQVVGIGSDLGLSHAINTMGARVRDERHLLGRLYAGARFYGYRLYAVSACVVVALYASMQTGHGWSQASVGAVLVFILLISALQVTVNFRKAVLNVHHDAKALFYVGMVQAGLRMLFVPLCLVWPYAAVAILGNLAGTYAGKLVIERQSRSRLDEKQPVTVDQKDDLKKFIVPLAPVLIYFALQGQISIFLLGYYGYTTSIAEVGALARLAQLIGLFMLLNSFFVMPVFSRINQRDEFIKKGGMVVLGLTGFTVISMLSVYMLPDWWLLILGQNYANLGNELPIAVFAALMDLTGATLYVLVISRNKTKGQSWYIALGLTTQTAFLAMHGVHSTYDALWLNLMPILSYACVQAVLLASILHNWKDETNAGECRE